MKTKLKDVCNVLVPMRDKPKYFVDKENGIPWCRIEDIEGKYLNTSLSNKYVDKETIDKLRLKVFPQGTVITAVTGASIGTYAITTQDLVTNQTFAGLLCRKDLYNNFLYYFINLYTKNFINMSVGCAQAYITRESLEEIELNLPTIEEQKGIVKILECIDNQIENNNKINKELERIAKTLYNYWFVQFDFPDENKRPLISRIFALLSNPFRLVVQYA